MKLIKALEQVRRDCKTNSEKFAVSRAIQVVDRWFKDETSFDSQIDEARELEQALVCYGNLKFLVEPTEAWQAVQSCVYLSGLDVEND